MSIKCPKWQLENTPDSKFCKECGTQFPSLEKIEIIETIETPKEELTRGRTYHYDGVYPWGGPKKLYPQVRTTSSWNSCKNCQTGL